MQDTIKIKGGKSGKALEPRELAYHTEEKALYIGGTEKEGNVKLTFPPIASQSSLNSSASLANVVTAFNNLIAAMKASGMMK